MKKRKQNKDFLKITSEEMQYFSDKLSELLKKHQMLNYERNIKKTQKHGKI